MGWKYNIGIVVLITVVTVSLATEVLCESRSFDKDTITSDVYHGLVASCAGDQRTLFHLSWYYNRYDAYLVSEGLDPVGIGDNFSMLYNSAQNNREERLRNASVLLRSDPDIIVKNIVRHDISNDEINLRNRLRFEDRYNIVADTFNYSMSLVSQVMFGNTQALAQAFVDVGLSWKRLSELSVRQRKSLVLLERFVRKHPKHDLNVSLQKEIDLLSDKKRRFIYDRFNEYGDIYKSVGNIDEALAYYRYAQSIFPNSKKSRKKILQTQKMKFLRIRERAESLYVKDGESEFSQREKKIYFELLYTVAIGDCREMFEGAKKYEKKLRNTSLADEALYIEVTALDMAGQTDMAEALRAYVAVCFSKSNCGLRCAIDLRNENAYSFGNFERSVKQYEKETLRYILKGRRSHRDKVRLLATGITQQGSDFLSSIGFFFIIDVAVRGVATRFYNPISYDSVVRSGILYTEQNRSSKHKNEVYERLAQVYGKSRQYHKSIAMLEKLPESKKRDKRIRKLKSKLARRLYYYALGTMGENGEDDDIKGEKQDQAPRQSHEEAIRALTYITKYYADTKYAKKASAKLENIHLIDKKKETEKKKSDSIREEREDKKQEPKFADFTFAELANPPPLTPKQKIIPFEIEGSLGSKGATIYPSLQKYRYSAEDEKLYR